MLNHFQPHESLVFERALRWWDTSDALAAKGELKGAMDASASALRLWRVLKFAGPGAVRRPGRPSGDAWNEQRLRNARRAVGGDRAGAA